MNTTSLPLLAGKKVLVTGIANDQSIAWGCAKAFHAFGAEVANRSEPRQQRRAEMVCRPRRA